MSEAAIMARLAALEARVSELEAGGATSVSPARGSGLIASDYEMSGPYGDPVVKKDPKRWTEAGGDSFAGCKMSECPADYLREVASLNDWMADQDDAKKKTYVNKKTGVEGPASGFARNTAKLARGWAARAEKRGPAPSPPARDPFASAASSGGYDQGQGDADDSIPF